MTDDEAPRRASFDTGKWRAKLLFTPSEFKELVKLARDDGALRAHLQQMQGITLSDAGPTRVSYSDLSTEDRDTWRLAKREDVTAAMELLARQMVVVGMSYCEGLLVEYCQALFEARPQKMHDFLGVPEHIGRISLKEIVGASSREDLLTTLAKSAGKRVVDRKITKTLGHTAVLSGITFPQTLIDTLQSFSDARNRIVHDVVEPDIKPDDVNRLFDALSALVTCLGAAAPANGVSANDPSDMSDHPHSHDEDHP